MFYVFGLGNPTDKYANTRHNIGRDVVDGIRIMHGFSDWNFDKLKNCQMSSGQIGDKEVTLILPDTYMNDSGESARFFMTDEGSINNSIVVYDDLDLAFGEVKISFNKNSGGHKGVQSIIDHVKNKEFSRVRIGIAPVTEEGEMRKVSGTEKVKTFVLKPFTEKEKEKLSEIFKESVNAVEKIIEIGYIDAMNEVN